MVIGLATPQGTGANATPRRTVFAAAEASVTGAPADIVDADAAVSISVTNVLPAVDPLITYSTAVLPETVPAISLTLPVIPPARSKKRR